MSHLSSKVKISPGDSQPTGSAFQSEDSRRYYYSDHAVQGQAKSYLQWSGPTIMLYRVQGNGGSEQKAKKWKAHQAP